MMLLKLKSFWLYVKLYGGWFLTGITVVISGLFFMFNYKQQQETVEMMKSQSVSYRKQLEELQKIANTRRETEKELEQTRDKKLQQITEQQTSELTELKQQEQEQIKTVSQEDPAKIAEELNKTFGFTVTTGGTSVDENK
jgi:biopolymer transport protein ExbB/TolQ